MRPAWLVLAIVGSSAGDARADYDPEWRDGCPGGNLSRTPDIRHQWSDKLERYAGTRPDLVGALPQADSALANNQVGFDGMVAHFASQGALGSSASMYGGVLRGDINYPFSHWLQTRWAGGLNLALSSHRLEDGRTHLDRLGNLVFQPAIRGQWVATGTNVVDSLGDPDHQAAGLRNGIAAQAIVSVPLDQSMSARDESASVWRRDAFEGYLVSPRLTWGGAFEIRTEGVGCYAPFIHLRLSATATRAATNPNRPLVEHMVVLAPQTLTFGFSPSSHATVLVQYGLLVYFTEETARGSPVSLIGATAIHRFRFGGERVFDGVTVAAHLDLFLGSPLYDGTVFGVSVSWHPGDWR